jgi:predicted RNA-binding protein YlxR (DUF448 family)
MKNRTPIRMCISCRKRESQKSLFRLQKQNRGVIRYSGSGRSFYICRACLDDYNKVLKRVSKILGLDLKDNSLEVVLKELKDNVKNKD